MWGVWGRGRTCIGAYIPLEDVADDDRKLFVGSHSDEMRDKQRDGDPRGLGLLNCRIMNH